MRFSVLVDTSVLIALLSRDDRYHQWALNTVSRLQKPFLTCEAVIDDGGIDWSRVTRVCIIWIGDYHG